MDSDEVGSITYSVDGNGPYLRIQTIDGAMRVSQGYWIIRGVHGELSLCSPDLFAKNYEPAQ